MHKVKKHFLAVGTMSGTSFDGVDASLIKTDGKAHIEDIFSITINYNEKERELYSSLKTHYQKITNVINKKHIKAIKILLEKSRVCYSKIDVIGLHGQTFIHKPNENWSWQYINPKIFLKEFKTKIITDFRLKDINYGGEGAPIVPVFHNALVNSKKITSYPIAVINIGGVSNATIITKRNKFYGYDTGPGNGPLDAIANNRFNIHMDKEGSIALKGTVNKKIAMKIIYFISNFPNNSFDRNQLDSLCLEKTNKLKPDDALATISFVIANLIYSKLKKYSPEIIIILGGGRKNLSIKYNLEKKFGNKIFNGDDLGIDGDSVESQALAYLAVRSLLGLKYTYNHTTGVKYPLSGGVLHNYN